MVELVIVGHHGREPGRVAADEEDREEIRIGGGERPRQVGAGRNRRGRGLRGRLANRQRENEEDTCCQSGHGAVGRHR